MKCVPRRALEVVPGFRELQYSLMALWARTQRSVEVAKRDMPLQIKIAYVHMSDTERTGVEGNRGAYSQSSTETIWEGRKGIFVGDVSVRWDHVILREVLMSW